MKKFFYTLLVMAMTAPVYAAVDLTGLAVDTATPEALTAIILTGLAVIWGIRKLVKIINRS